MSITNSKSRQWWTRGMHLSRDVDIQSSHDFDVTLFGDGMTISVVKV